MNLVVPLILLSLVASTCYSAVQFAWCPGSEINNIYWAENNIMSRGSISFETAQDALENHPYLAPFFSSSSQNASSSSWTKATFLTNTNTNYFVPALDEAYKGGFRVYDFLYEPSAQIIKQGYLDRRPDSREAAIEDYNSRIPNQADRIKFKARLTLYPSVLLRMIEWINSTAACNLVPNNCLYPQTTGTNLFPTGFPFHSDLINFSTFTVPDAESFMKSKGVPASTYLFYSARANVGGATFRVLNIANPIIRQYIRAYARMAVHDLRNNYPNTDIAEMVLVYQTDGETTLDAGIDGRHEVTSFPTSPYELESGSIPQEWLTSPLSNLDNLADHFSKNEDYVKQAISTFVTGVKEAQIELGLTPIKTGVFIQSWATDNVGRGIVDTYRALKGTKINILYHTPQPNSLRYHQGVAAFPATIVKYLSSKYPAVKAEFQTEFSWATYHGMGIATQQPVLNDDHPTCSMNANMTLGNSMLWYSSCYLERSPQTNYPGVEGISELNSYGFLNQTKAAIQYGATGVVYANWLGHLFSNPPSDASWQELLSPILSSSVLNTPELSEAKTAVFLPKKFVVLSQVLQFMSAGAQALNYPTVFLRTNEIVFATLSSIPQNEKIDVLTDVMVEDNPNDLLSTYGRIVLPFAESELSRYLSVSQIAILKNYKLQFYGNITRKYGSL